jgi:restriction endonuclease S subunit
MFDNCILDNDNISLKVRDNNIINQKYFNYYFLYMLSPILLSTTIGKSKKIDINALLSTEISIPSLEAQNKIIDFFDINYMAINQTKKQIETINILKNKYIETLCDNYPMIKIKDICDVDTKPSDNNPILCVQRNSKSAGNTYYYDNSNIINNNVYYLNNINKNKCYNVSSLYILLKYNEANLNKLASITNTINLSRTNLENFEIKDIPIDIQEKLTIMINKYDNMLKLSLVNIENLLNANIFN